MKEAIGGSWIFGIFIAFVALFTSFMSISANYSKCYKVKDEILSAIQINHGVNEDALKEIKSYMANIGYRTEGTCPDEGGCWAGFSTSNSNNIAGYGDEINYCIKKNLVTGTVNGTRVGPIGHVDSAYYSVVVFFGLDMPILQQIFHFEVEGETSIVFNNRDFTNMKNC